MTRRDELLALAERCEKESEGSRVLDAEIAAILRICPIDDDWLQNWTGEWRAINGLVHLIGDYGSSGNFRPPEYTTSLDAAMTLVPEGWESIRFERTQDTIGCFLDAIDTNAATPALALCAAALRAAAEMES